MTSATFEVRDGIGHLRLTAGDRGNAMNLAMVTDLLRAVQDARRSGAQVVVLSAEGRFFSVGGDLAAFHGAEDPSALLDDVTAVLHRAVNHLLQLDAIVVVALQGAAAGAGTPLVLAGDIVVAGESTKLTLGYTSVGLSPDGGSTSLLPANLGLHRTLQLTLLNTPVTAEQARELGLVAEVVPNDQVAARAHALAQQFRDGAILASLATKRLVRASFGSPATRMELEARSICSLVAGAEAMEGMSAFLEKRRPDFSHFSASPPLAANRF